jgi:hypothetical protein
MPGLDHREICRYDDLSDAGLQLILGALRDGLTNDLSSVATSRAPNDAFNYASDLHSESGSGDKQGSGNSCSLSKYV